VTVDFLILGQGLAGSLLAWELSQRGVSWHVLDQPLPGAASAVAPGLVNPLSGRKFTTNWRAAEARPVAEATYAQLEATLGQTFWHPTPLLRLVRDADQAAALTQRQTEASAQPHIAEVFAPHHWDPALRSPHGSFLTAGGGWLDVAGLCRALRARWRAAGHLTEGDAALADQISAACIIDCRGWRASLDPRWQFIPWKCARGEMLDLKFSPDALPPHILNFGEWLVPVSEGHWRAGATYAWSRFDAPPDLAARMQLEGALRRWLNVPYTVTAQRCGVRPIVHDYRPILGPAPDDPHWMIFNGLGSHGVSQGPLCAHWLATHLCESTTLPDDVIVTRFAS